MSTQLRLSDWRCWYIFEAANRQQDLLASGEASWLWDRNTLNPLLGAMDAKMNDLQARNTELQLKIPELTARCEALLSENNDLHEQITRSTSNDATGRLMAQQNQQLRMALAAAHKQIQRAVPDKVKLVDETAKKRHHQTDKLRQAEIIELKSRLANIQQVANDALARNKQLGSVAKSRKELLATMRGLVRQQKFVVRTAAISSADAASSVAALGERDAARAEAERLRQEVADAEFERDQYRQELENVLANSVAKTDVEAMCQGDEQERQELAAELKNVRQQMQQAQYRAECHSRDIQLYKDENQRLKDMISQDKTRSLEAIEKAESKLRADEQLRMHNAFQVQVTSAKLATDATVWEQTRHELEMEIEHQKRLQHKQGKIVQDMMHENSTLKQKLAALLERNFVLSSELEDTKINLKVYY